MISHLLRTTVFIKSKLCKFRRIPASDLHSLIPAFLFLSIRRVVSLFFDFSARRREFHAFLLVCGKELPPFGVLLSDDREAVGLQFHYILMEEEELILLYNGLLQNIESLQIILVVRVAVFPASERFAVVILIIKHEVVLLMCSLGGSA